MTLDLSSSSSAATSIGQLANPGNGQGAVSPRAYVAELPSLIEEIDAGEIAVSAVTAPLSDVEATWTRPEVAGQRTVLVP